MSLLETPRLTDARRDTIRSAAGHSAVFAMIGNIVRLRGNNPAPIEHLRNMYGRFEVADRGQPAQLEICYEVAGDRAVTFVIGQEAVRITHDLLVTDASATIMYLVMTHVRDHFIVHAGAVELAGRCIVISGASGMGKSTLVAHLAAGGMGYLSDELAPIARGTGLVEPFPARLGIRPGPAEQLLEDKPSAALVAFEDRKKLIDIEALTGRPAAAATPLHAVVFLTGNPSPEVATPCKFAGRVKVTLLESRPGFEDLLAERAHALVLKTGTSAAMPWYLLKVDQPESFLAALTNLLREQKLDLAGLAYENLDPPDYREEPRLVRIPQAAGVIELIKHIPSSYRNALIASEFGGKVTAMTREVAAVTSGAAFYKLSPGRLDRMIEMVRTLPE